MTGVGVYLYQGTGKANPHAVTSVGGTTYSYDDNGNLTSDSTWTHGWNYDNTLKQSVNGGTTVSYGYDHSGQRVKLANGSTTTKYANKFFNTDGSKNVKHIYAGDAVIATIENTTLQYVHTDHLTGSNVATDNAGGMVQLLDYFPYGSSRIDWKSGSFNEQRKFASMERDSDTGLDYANARYYKQNVGRFLSQDPVFLGVGDEQKIKQKTGMSFAEYLQNPQLANSYSYTANNPLKHIDKSGEFLFLAAYAVAYAPVWVPAAITIGAGIAASLQAKFFGEGLGHLIEGNQQGFEQAVQKQQAVVAVSATAGAGAMSLLSPNQTSVGSNIAANKARGDAFEAKTLSDFRAAYPQTQPQLTVKTANGIKTRLDMIVPTGNNTFCLVECKSSPTASLTKNQSLAFPEIQKSGGVIVGGGKPGLEGGTVIPPTQVQVVRP